MVKIMYIILNIFFNLFIFLFGVTSGAIVMVSEARKYGYMKVDPKDKKIKWVHKIKE